ncbi:MAG: hypothetical protein ACD_62C00198G0001 [uncultured bacterium]|nr:MAG: hypothetical protein ACD_62C00198G0001 [uncultured bacterium]HLD44497.1 50S ribosomal protein L33 [bacterium]
MNLIVTVSLECEVCKKRNYRFKINKDKKDKKLKLKKFCKYCKAHTMHVQVR